MSSNLSNDNQAQARKLLTDLCDQRPFYNVLRNVECWAIVGGAVRDALLLKDFDKTHSFREWADIDIALTAYPPKDFFIPHASTSEKVGITKNHFGGIKINVAQFGQLDLWVWKANKTLAKSDKFWLKQLDSVDFGINAVAFTWPMKRMIMHSRWEQDLKLGQVEKLASESPRRNFQPIRAVALATKLEEKTGKQIKLLGPQALKELKWLLCKADDKVASSALLYLDSKVNEGRWSTETICRLAQLSIEYKASENVIRKVFLLASKFNLGTRDLCRYRSSSSIN